VVAIEQRAERGRISDATRCEQRLVGDLRKGGAALVEPAQRDDLATAAGLGLVALTVPHAEADPELHPGAGLAGDRERRRIGPADETA